MSNVVNHGLGMRCKDHGGTSGYAGGEGLVHTAIKCNMCGETQSNGHKNTCEHGYTGIHD